MTAETRAIRIWEPMSALPSPTKEPMSRETAETTTMKDSRMMSLVTTMAMIQPQEFLPSFRSCLLIRSNFLPPLP